jgi:hypothetical protein
MFTLLDDKGRKFVMTYVNHSKNSSHEEKCFIIVWVVLSF